MSRMINTLYEQQYYTEWVNKDIEKSKALLNDDALVISLIKTESVDGVYHHMVDIKESFSEELDMINVSFIKKLNISEKKDVQPKKIMLDVDEKNIYITLLDKDYKEFQTLQMNLYFQEISKMLDTTIELANFEIMQLGFIKSAPMKFLLQPIILEESDLSVDTIDVVVTLYEDGLLIIDFNMVFHEVPFIQLQNYESDEDKEYYLKRHCKIPELITNIKSENPNRYLHDKFMVKDAISLYIKHIFSVLRMKIDSKEVNKYVNYSLIRYEGEPENFDSTSKELSSDMYWIIHMPRNYTEMTKSKYNEFVENRYEISKYAALFVNSMGRSLIAMTKDKIKVDNIELSEDSHKYTLRNYIDPVARIILIKKMYYQRIWSHNETEHDNDLNDKESMIFYFKDRMSKITHKSYGSVKRCVEYIEKNMIDYLNFEEIDEIIVNFKSKKYLDMTEKNEKLNRRINHLIALITILFSYNPLDVMLTGLSDSNVIDLTEYLFEIWVSLWLITLLIIYIENIINLNHVIFEKIKILISEVKKIFNNFRSKG